jgi:hypothetical protein
MIVNFSSKGCQIYSESDCSIEGNVVASMLEIDGMYRLCLKQGRDHVTVERQMQELWHRRLGHLSLSGMKQLRGGMAKGLDFSDHNIQPCMSCIQEKQNRRRFPKNKSKRATGKLVLIHTDICGPIVGMKNMTEAKENFS